MVNIRVKISKSKVTCYTKAVNFTNKKMVDVAYLKLLQFTQSREVTEKYQIFDKPDHTRYGFTLGRDFKQYIGLVNINSDLAFICNELQVTIVDIRYYNNTIIYCYQWNRAMGKPEESHAQAHILYDNGDKSDLE